MRKNRRFGVVGPQLIKERCVTFGCGRPTYALWVCRRCYEMARQKGTIVPSLQLRCFVPGCDNIYTLGSNNGLDSFTYKLCKKHRIKACILRGKKRVVTLKELADKPPGWHHSGEKNHNWQGGVFPYTEHRAYQKKRKALLEKYDYKCQLCGGHAVTVRRINKDPTDQRMKNLQVICHGCLTKTAVRRNAGYMTKYRRIYGKSKDEMAKENNVSVGTIRNWFVLGWEPGKPVPRGDLHKVTAQMHETAREKGVSLATVYNWKRKGLWKPKVENSIPV